LNEIHGEVSVAKTLGEALEQLKREPDQPVQATVEGMIVEVRVVPQFLEGRSAAEVLAAIGPWEGETTEELMAFLSEARCDGRSRRTPGL
jgi:hypothetical protein